MNKLTTAIGRLFGIRFAPDNHVVPVLRMEQFDRLEGPGYFRINPLKETTLSPFSLGIRLGEFNFAEVLTYDNIPFNVTVTVLFRLDLQKTRPQALPQIVRAAPDTLLNIVKNHVEHGLRRLAARHKAEEIGHTEALADIERNLKHLLHARLQRIGLEPIPDGILIKETIAPEKFKEAMLAAHMHRTTLQALGGIHDTRLIEQAIRAQFLTRLEAHQGDVTLFSSFEGLALPTQADVMRFAGWQKRENNVQDVSG